MENLQLSIVWHHQVEARWPELGPWILLAVGDNADKTDVDYIKNQCISGNAVIFTLSRNDNIEAVLVCETAFYGGKKTLILRWMSGSSRENYLPYIHVVEDYAYHHGFERLELWGRKGWERVFKVHGFGHEYTVLGKFVTKRVH